MSRRNIRTNRRISRASGVLTERTRVSTREYQPRGKLKIEKMRNSCGDVSELLKALSHPQRLLLMGYLTGGARTVGEIQELCGISQSQISQFLARMKAEGLVESERDGKFNYYRISDPKVGQLIELLHELFCN